METEDACGEAQHEQRDDALDGPVGGHGVPRVTAFFADTPTFAQKHVHSVAYNGINLGRGWRNLKDSTPSKDFATLTIRSISDAGDMVWFAPARTYKPFVVDSQGKKLGESSSILRVSA